MPIYEYQCKDCGEISELLQKISDPPATTCPECGAEALTKQVSAAGFRLAGGGWYETDFKKDGKRNLKDSGGASNDSGKTASAAPGKPEATPKAAAAGT
ncbi:MULTISPECIES: FmdB family zinc ribbon protein [unclassified Thioalkalivibrio]|uniref:FmdB family zinc ribbon protein n=1 Tax=unclassified Thioalkalivibrio TaxID=2621013 RepID=UPI00037409FD|nr:MULTISPECIES: zinc ribbon domain-containing protein [unclassified Thioalkalivibrio]